MGEIKKIALKGLLLLALLIGLNAAYEHWVLPHHLAEYSESGDILYSKMDTSDIYYVSESSNFTSSNLDLDKRSISTFLNAYYPNHHVGAISRGALHAGNFYRLLCNAPFPGPKTVILTMNMRSFDASWINSKLETALQKEMVLLNPGPAIWRRFMLSLREYEKKTLEERRQDVLEKWKNDTLRFPYPFPHANVLDWDTAISRRTYAKEYATMTPAQKAEIPLACHFVKNFAFQIDTETNPRIHDFDRIVALAQKRGWNLVMVLIPENVETAERIVGKDLIYLMRQNRDILVERYAKQPGVTFLDLLEALPDADFTDRDWPNEHYLEHGRSLLADRIAHGISKLYPGEMQVPKFETTLPKVFVNDCEGGNVWMNMETLDEAHAHSGKRASRIGGGKVQYGVALTHQVAHLDTNAMDSLDFSCWVLADALDFKAIIAWQGIGNPEAESLWQGFPLSDGITEAKAWYPVHFRVPLWPELKKAKIFKVYPFTKEEVSVWIDDIRIEFLPKKPA